MEATCKLEQKLDIIISRLSKKEIIMNNFSCPMCTSTNKNSFNHYILDNEYTAKHSIKTFIDSAFLQRCYKCNQDYYIGVYFLQYATNGSPFADMCVTAMSIKAFNEFKEKHYNKEDLINYLPEDKELLSRYEDLVKCFNDNNSYRQKLFNIRSVLEAYLVYTNDIKTAHNLHNQVDKLECDDNLKDLFKHIIRQCVNAIHVKEEIANIDPDKAYKLIEIILTSKYKHPKLIEAINLRQNKEIKQLDTELQNLIKNF